MCAVLLKAQIVWPHRTLLSASADRTMFLQCVATGLSSEAEQDCRTGVAGTPVRKPGAGGFCAPYPPRTAALARAAAAPTRARSQPRSGLWRRCRAARCRRGCAPPQPAYARWCRARWCPSSTCARSSRDRPRLPGLNVRRLERWPPSRLLCVRFLPMRAFGGSGTGLKGCAVRSDLRHGPHLKSRICMPAGDSG